MKVCCTLFATGASASLGLIVKRKRSEEPELCDPEATCARFVYAFSEVSRPGVFLIRMIPPLSAQPRSSGYTPPIKLTTETEVIVACLVHGGEAYADRQSTPSLRLVAIYRWKSTNLQSPEGSKISDVHRPSQR
ncbi:hypothetical protein FA95DRAFT_129727 [Auriscalpium vulgare]|uniref:Uncharacterized protein n=1 Tax=Auriscalpium vulgare TaxID=40419 RepID=A0ACB8RNA7_9AGAM|nr:hypothetical protein FA95DRAFT_129727 [Auriscalpium vulgare]